MKNFMGDFVKGIGYGVIALFFIVMIGLWSRIINVAFTFGWNVFNK